MIENVNYIDSELKSLGIIEKQHYNDYTSEIWADERVDYESENINLLLKIGGKLSGKFIEGSILMSELYITAEGIQKFEAFKESDKVKAFEESDKIEIEFSKLFDKFEQNGEYSIVGLSKGKMYGDALTQRDLLDYANDSQLVLVSEIETIIAHDKEFYQNVLLSVREALNKENLRDAFIFSRIAYEAWLDFEIPNEDGWMKKVKRVTGKGPSEKNLKLAQIRNNLVHSNAGSTEKKLSINDVLTQVKLIKSIRGSESILEKWCTELSEMDRDKIKNLQRS